MEILARLGLLAAAIPVFIYGGFVFSKLWEWFVVPALKVDPIRLPLAMGFVVIFEFLKGYKGKKRSLKEEVKLMVESVLWVSILLLTGWVLHFFV